MISKSINDSLLGKKKFWLSSLMVLDNPNPVWSFSTHCLWSGEDHCYSTRALLLYDGVHYDPLLIEGAGGDIVQTVFPVTDDSVLIEAVQIAKYAFQVNPNCV